VTKIQLDQVRVHLLSDVSEVLILGAMESTETVSQGGGVRVYAGGVRRTIQTDENTRSLQYQFPLMSRSDHGTLRSWLGQGVMVRDLRGHLVYGTVFQVAGVEHPDTAEDRIFRVNWTVNEITFQPFETF